MKKTNMFEKFMDDNIDAAYRFAFTYAKNKEDAEDILNESVVKALRSLHTLKDPDKIKPWFFTIIARTALNQIKSRQKIVFMEQRDMETLETVTDDYSNMDFAQLIACLDPKYKAILVLRFLEDMTIADTAQILGLSESTVKTRLYKALELLKAEI